MSCFKSRVFIFQVASQIVYFLSNEIVSSKQLQWSVHVCETNKPDGLTSYCKIKNAELRVEQLWCAGNRRWQMWNTYKPLNVLPVSYPVTKEWFCPSFLFHQTRWETSPSVISVTKKQTKQKLCFCFVSFYTFAAFKLSWCEWIFYFGVQRNSRGRCGSQDTSCRSASQRGRSISPSACKSAPTGERTCFISFKHKIIRHF